MPYSRVVEFAVLTLNGNTWCHERRLAPHDDYHLSSIPLCYGKVQGGMGRWAASPLTHRPKKSLISPKHISITITLSTLLKLMILLDYCYIKWMFSSVRTSETELLNKSFSWDSNIKQISCTFPFSQRPDGVILYYPSCSCWCSSNPKTMPRIFCCIYSSPCQSSLNLRYK